MTMYGQLIGRSRGILSFRIRFFVKMGIRLGKDIETNGTDPIDLRCYRAARAKYQTLA